MGKAKGREQIPEGGGESREERMYEIRGKKIEGEMQIRWR